MAGLDWGPVSRWAGASATVLLALISLVVAFRLPDRLWRPRIELTFEPRQPWCRNGRSGPRGGYWVRIGVENARSEPAHGCVGRLIGLTTDGSAWPSGSDTWPSWSGSGAI